MPLYRWSQTSANNATADPTINWAEGQAPSSINDSARAMMSATAKYRDDISGAIATSGTSTAYTVSSNQVFDTLAHLDGQMIAFTPHTTNGATVTLNVDSLGAKPLRSAPSTELAAGVLIQGTPYLAVYNNTDAAFYLHGFYGDGPTSVPIGASIPYWGSTVPNSLFVFPYGQAISRTTYATCFSRLGTTFGVGDGSTTFNLPDQRGRSLFGYDAMGGVAASRLSSFWAALGIAGGVETASLTQANLPNVNFTVSIPSGQGSHAHVVPSGAHSPNTYAGASSGDGAFAAQDTQAATLPAMSGTAASGGSGTAISRMPPAIVCNFILRVI